MKTTKRLWFKPFLLYDKAAIEAFFRKQALRGWFPDNSTQGWCFFRTKPRDLRFSVFYFPEARSWYPELILPQKEFLELCNHTGWYLAKHLPGMLILCNENPNATPIETDPVLEVENIGKAETARYKGTWAGILFWVIYFGWRIYQNVRDVVGMEFPDNWQSPGLTKTDFFVSTDLLLGLLLLLLYPVFRLLEYSRFRLWYRKAKNLAEDGKVHSPRWGVNLAPWLYIFFVAVYLLATYQSDAKNFWMFLLLCDGLAGAVVFGIVRLLKELRCKLWLRIVIAAAVTGALLVPLHAISQSPALPGSLGMPETIRVACHCPVQEESHMRYQEDIPLRIEDLTGQVEEETVWATCWNGRRSPLLGKYSFWQKPCMVFDNEQVLHCAIYDIGVPWLYDLCWEEAFYLGHWGKYLNTRATQGVHYVQILQDETSDFIVYQRYDDNGAQSHYILCMETRIVDLDIPVLLTDQQLQKAAQILRNCPLPNT